MSIFFLMAGKMPMTERELKAVGGAKKLEQMSAKDLESLGIRKADDSALGLMRDGKPLQFGASSGIKVTEVSGDPNDPIWRKGWSVRGFQGENEMGSTGILPKNFPTIDDAVFKDRIFTSYKTIDLDGVTYQNPENLRRKLETYLDKLADWPGQEKPWGGHVVDPDRIEQRVLHIGIPNSSMSPEQIKVFKQLSRKTKDLDIHLKVTAIE